MGIRTRGVQRRRPRERNLGKRIPGVAGFPSHPVLFNGRVQSSGNSVRLDESNSPRPFLFAQALSKSLVRLPRGTSRGSGPLALPLLSPLKWQGFHTRRVAYSKLTLQGWRLDPDRAAAAFSYSKTPGAPANSVACEFCLGTSYLQEHQLGTGKTLTLKSKQWRC